MKQEFVDENDMRVTTVNEYMLNWRANPVEIAAYGKAKTSAGHYGVLRRRNRSSSMRSIHYPGWLLSSEIVDAKVPPNPAGPSGEATKVAAVKVGSGVRSDFSKIEHRQSCAVVDLLNYPSKKTNRSEPQTHSGTNHTMMDHEDQSMYRTFCERQILEKSVNTLLGIVAGISADNETNTKELELLNEWMMIHSPYERLHPFNEFFPLLNSVLADGILDESERDDIAWLARKVINGELLSSSKSDMQVLHGIMQGIIADGQINKGELVFLQDWLNDHEHLRRIWPYDEIESLLMTTLKDGVIDEAEHKMLKAFLQDFCELKPDDSDSEVVHSVTGVCAVCPEIQFDGKKFTMTGSSDRMKRSEFETKVTELGGIAHPRVTKDLDYLVIGSCGNPCWAYACYGRKVELAMKLRREGSPLMIVHENDFWDAIMDLRS